MKIGYSTWGMPTIPVDTFVPFLARLGYEGIELTVFPGYTIELSLLDAAERQRITNNSAHYRFLELQGQEHRGSLVRGCDRTPSLLAQITQPHLYWWGSQLRQLHHALLTWIHLCYCPFKSISSQSEPKSV